MSSLNPIAAEIPSAVSLARATPRRHPCFRAAGRVAGEVDAVAITHSASRSGPSPSSAARRPCTTTAEMGTGNAIREQGVERRA
jgi:hypothetical protein